MTELKTKKTELSVEAFLNGISEPEKRKDAQAILRMMEEATKAKAKMWGTAIVGFGDRLLMYENGRQLDWFVMGFSPRKQNFALYVPGVVEKRQALLNKLGKHKTGKGCLYVHRLEEIDVAVLKQIIQKGLEI